MRLLRREKLLWQVQTSGGHIYEGLLFSDTLRGTSRCWDGLGFWELAWKEKLKQFARRQSHEPQPGKPASSMEVQCRSLCLFSVPSWGSKSFSKEEFSSSVSTTALPAFRIFFFHLAWGRANDGAFLLAGPAILSVVCVRVGWLVGWLPSWFPYVAQTGLDCSVHRPMPSHLAPGS